MSPFPVIVPRHRHPGRPASRWVIRWSTPISSSCRTLSTEHPAAVAFDLKSFFAVIDKDPLAVVPADVFEFLADQRGDRTVVRMSDGESGLSARTIARRLSSVSASTRIWWPGRHVGRDEPGAERTLHPPARRSCPDGAVGSGPRTLPKILSPEMSTHWSVHCAPSGPGHGLAMVLGGLRRCEVLGLRLSDIQVAERSVFVAEGKAATSGGPHLQHLLRRAGRVSGERTSEGRVDEPGVRDLEGPEPGQGSAPRGGDHLVERPPAGRARACHLPSAPAHLSHPTAGGGHALEASRPSRARLDRVDPDLLHLTNDWLANEYHQAMGAVDAHAAELLAMVEMAQ